MRNKLRIPICLKLFFENKAIYEFVNITKPDYNKLIFENKELIEKTWLKNPDLRFGQLLCNLGLTSDLDVENNIWNVEEDNWLIENNYCNIEDIKFWGINFYKNNKRRKTVKYVLLNDLKTDHIINIIKFFENNLNKIPVKYLEYFNKKIDESK